MVRNGFRPPETINSKQLNLHNTPLMARQQQRQRQGQGSTRPCTTITTTNDNNNHNNDKDYGDHRCMITHIRFAQNSDFNRYGQAVVCFPGTCKKKKKKKSGGWPWFPWGLLEWIRTTPCTLTRPLEAAPPSAPGACPGPGPRAARGTRGLEGGIRGIQGIRALWGKTREQDMYIYIYYVLYIRRCEVVC